MFRPKEMHKIRILILKSKVESLVKDLHDIGCFDIRKSNLDIAESASPLHKFDSISGVLTKMRAILAIMRGNLKNHNSELQEMNFESAMEEAKKLEILADDFKKLENEDQELIDSLKDIETKLTNLTKINHFAEINFSQLNTKILSYKLYEVSDITKARNVLRNIDTLKIVSSEGWKRILLIFERKDANLIEEIAQQNNFVPLDLPYGTTTPSESIIKLKEQKEKSINRRNLIKEEINEISVKNIDKVKQIVSSLSAEADRAHIVSKFSMTKSVYIVEGWIIGSDNSKIQKIVDHYSPNAVLERIEYDPHHETPPTVLDNPGVVKPFEFITKTYSLPSYKDLDPTIAYAIGLPIIYGMIVGDAIYGIMSAIIAVLMMKKFAKSDIMMSVGSIWLVSAIPSFIFGVLFDEWAAMNHVDFFNFIGSWIGVKLISAPLYQPWLHRLHDLFELFIITMSLGVIHMTLGFLLGFINEWGHSKKHAFAKIGWLMFLYGLLSIIAIPQFGTIGGICALIGIVVLLVTEGAAGMVEIPGLFGNILSYTRIATVGIVGVILAEIINESLMPNPTQGPIAIILFPIFVLLHAVNCLLAMFESLIQGGRLNIFEFKSKFLNSNGGFFSPFKKR